MILQGDISLDRAWEISPYNGAAYGGIVVLFIIIIYYLIKQLEKKEEYIQKQNDKLHEVIDDLGVKLVELKSTKTESSEKILFVLDLIKQRLQDLYNKK